MRVDETVVSSQSSSHGTITSLINAQKTQYYRPVSLSMTTIQNTLYVKTHNGPSVGHDALFHRVYCLLLLWVAFRLPSCRIVMNKYKYFRVRYLGHKRACKTCTRKQIWAHVVTLVRFLQFSYLLAEFLRRS